jgi:hypothetical protein
LAHAITLIRVLAQLSIEHRHLDRVVVVDVVRRELVVPLERAGIRVERDDRVGVEFVAGRCAPL